VVLAGNGAQEIAGVDVPVVYRAYYAQDGFTLAHPNDYFGAYQKKDIDRYERFLKGVKATTGKELTSFIGELCPGPLSEPYTVRPVADK
jgi:hypothetical protein